MSLIVEDGSGVTNADSYSAVTYADTFLGNYTGSTTWTSATTTQKEVGLRNGTEFLDIMYGMRWKGIRSQDWDGQSLDWPRAYVVTRDGYEYSSNEIPVEIKKATCFLALSYLSDDSLFSSPNPNGSIKRKMVKAGPVETETEYNGGALQQKYYSKIDKLVSDLLTSAAELSR